MKKLLSMVIVISILLTSAVSVFATGDYTIEKKSIYYLRSDGALYQVIGNTAEATAKLVDTDVVLCGKTNLDKDYFGSDYKEYFKSIGTLVFTETDMAHYSGSTLIFNSEEDATTEIPNLTDAIGYYLFLADDGKVYEFGNYGAFEHYLYCIANIGKIKEFQEDNGYQFLLTEDNTLYATGGGIGKVATDVKDFKVSDGNVSYRTNNNDLYVFGPGRGNTPEFLLSNCSQRYFHQAQLTVAKTNDGKWYHMGTNSNFRLEPQRKVDGNNITPTEFKTMVEATEYIFRYGVWEWNIDGNLYCCFEGSRDLIAENVLMFDGSKALTQDGDLVVFINKSGNLMGDFLDANIKEPEKFATFNTNAFINKDNNLVVILENDAEKRSYLQEIKLGEKYPDRSDWAETEIAQADEIGYIDSVKQIPMQNNIKREEFCNMIVDFCEKYLGKELSKTGNPFKDTENEKVIKAYANGIITGISSNEFAPDNEITREQMCAIMTRASKFLKPDVRFGEGIKFSDMNQVSDWAVEGVNAMSGLGIVKGDGYSITPKSNTSVEQAIAMTYRLYNKIK